VTVYTVPWFPELDGSRGHQMSHQGVHTTMMVAIATRKLGWAAPFEFGLHMAWLFDGLPDDLQTKVARGAILTALRLGLIEERGGMVGPSDTLLRTRPWWEH
jgi:hypothetical protein